MKILIVDDNPGTCNAFRIGLISMGFQIATAADGEEALRMISTTIDTEERPELLLTDLRMPRMNGLDLIHKARELVPELPAILMTAYGDDQVRNVVKALDRCKFLDKPFTVQDLVSIIGTMNYPAGSLSMD